MHACRSTLEDPTESLDLTFAKGTKIDLAAVKACKATDEDLQAQGPSACSGPDIGRGQATVYIGTDTPLVLDAAVYPSGKKSVVVVLSNGDAVVRTLRGTFAGGTLHIAIPALQGANGHRVALVAFSIDLKGGTAKRPVYRTPATCTKKGWDVVYAPTFDPIGKVALVDNTACKR